MPIPSGTYIPTYREVLLAFVKWQFENKGDVGDQEHHIDGFLESVGLR